MYFEKNKFYISLHFPSLKAAVGRGRSLTLRLGSGRMSTCCKEKNMEDQISIFSPQTSEGLVNGQLWSGSAGGQIPRPLPPPLRQFAGLGRIEIGACFFLDHVQLGPRAEEQTPGKWCFIGERGL